MKRMKHNCNHNRWVVVNTRMLYLKILELDELAVFTSDRIASFRQVPMSCKTFCQTFSIAWTCQHRCQRSGLRDRSSVTFLNTILPSVTGMVITPSSCDMMIRNRDGKLRINIKDKVPLIGQCLYMYAEVRTKRTLARGRSNLEPDRPIYKAEWMPSLSSILCLVSLLCHYGFCICGFFFSRTPLFD